MGWWWAMGWDRPVPTSSAQLLCTEGDWEWYVLPIHIWDIPLAPIPPITVPLLTLYLMLTGVAVSGAAGGH